MGNHGCALGDGVAVGIDARIIGGELLHLVEAVLDRVELGHVTEMPLAGEVRLVPVLLVELGDGRRLFPEPVLVAGNNHDRKRRADRDAPGHERGAARGAAGLAVPAREHRAFLGKAIEVRRRVPERLAAEVGPQIRPPRVVTHQHDDVGLFLRRRRPCSQDQERQQHQTDH